MKIQKQFRTISKPDAPVYAVPNDNPDTGSGVFRICKNRLRLAAAVCLLRFGKFI